MNSEQASIVSQAIHAGLIRAADDVVGVGMQAIRERLNSSQTTAALMNAEEWSRELHTWVQSHAIDAPVLSDAAISRGRSTNRGL